MGVITTNALRDMTEALDVLAKGGTINLVPPKCEIIPNLKQAIFSLRLPIYGQHSNLTIRFHIDTMGFLTKVLVYESGALQFLTIQEESMLFDAYDWLWDQGEICHVQ